MAETPEPATSGTVQKYLGNKEFLRGWTRPPITFANWFGDGTLIFAAQDTDRSDGGLALADGLAAPYQRQFERSPELVAAISRAFGGEPISETVRIEGGPWDARLFPTFRDGKVGGVVGIFADARDRITAFRAVNAIELLSQIRHDLARSDSPEEFLSHCCDAIGKLHPPVWIGVADRGEEKKLQVITGTSDSSRRFASLNLSWDVGRKGGRHPAAQAVCLGRVQVIHNLTHCSDNDMWLDASAAWSSLIAVPLLANGASLGVLVIHSGDETDFDAEMVRLWEKIANEVTEGIELLKAKTERAKIVGERQGAHQQYRQLLDNIFDVIVVHRDGRIITINPAGVALSGAATGAELIGMQVIALIDPRDRNRIRDTLCESNAKGELQEFRLLSLDGETIDVEGMTVSVQHEGAEARLSVWRDISERKLNEATIVRQKTNLEYAQQVSKSGSIELDVATGVAEWSRNALTILELGPEMQEREFLNAVSSVLVDEHQELIAQLVDGIRKNAKELSCEVHIKTSDPARSDYKTIHIHGIPQIQQHVFVPRIFFVVQDISVFREAERHLKAKLLATWKLARVVEWTYHIDKQIIAWEGNLTDFLGYESPVAHLTYEQFMATIRPEDRELVRRSIERTLKHGHDGEMVYQETFDKGVTMMLYGRWRPVRDAQGRIVQLRGLSLDVTNIRHAHDREARKERINLHSGLPEKEMVYDRVYYLATRAIKLNKPFSIIRIQVHDYPEIKRHMANDALYYRTQGDIARAVMETITEVDTFGRLGRGSFVVILSREATNEDVEAAKSATVHGWQSALVQCESSTLDSVTVDTSVVHCPKDGTEWEGLLASLEKNFTA